MNRLTTDTVTAPSQSAGEQGCLQKLSTLAPQLSHQSSSQAYGDAGRQLSAHEPRLPVA